MDNELLALDAQEEDVKPFAADEFFTVGNGFAGRDARELEDIGVWGFVHKP